MTDLDLSDAPRLAEFLDQLPASTAAIADAMDVAPTTVEGYRDRLQETHDVDLRYDRSSNEWSAPGVDTGTDDTNTDETPDWQETPVADDTASAQDLTDRERYVARQLQTGATPAELADDLDTRESVVTQHFRDLRKRGWRVYHDDTADLVTIEGEHVLRSSEHTGTRTRKANRWWELRHNDLVREFRALDTPTATLDATDGNEDWVTHVTDLHAGDRVRRDDGTLVYETDEIPAVIDYITEQSLSLAEKHNSTYDTAHLLWGGDFVTNEGIYEGQFEDLDAWLDEQHDILVAPLIRQLKAFAEAFPTVQVIAQVGNHGQHRANGTSRQANADLILYKHIRNTVAHIRDHTDALDNVAFQIGQAKAFRNFDLRGGDLTGHLRHGQHRKPQAETSARKKEWQGTLLDHEFDLAFMGHYHISGRIPWDGPPVIVSPSPKPAGEFVERLAGRTPSEYQGVATVCGVSDDGLTTVFPVDTRNYDLDP